jgi:hypothetical protein
MRFVEKVLLELFNLVMVLAYMVWFYSLRILLLVMATGAMWVIRTPEKPFERWVNYYNRNRG